MHSGSRTVLVLQKCYRSPTGHVWNVQYQNTSLTARSLTSTSPLREQFRLATQFATGGSWLCSVLQHVLYHGPQYARAQGISTGLVSYSSAPIALPTLVPRPRFPRFWGHSSCFKGRLALVLCRGSSNGALLLDKDRVGTDVRWVRRITSPVPFLPERPMKRGSAEKLGPGTFNRLLFRTLKIERCFHTCLDS